MKWWWASWASITIPSFIASSQNLYVRPFFLCLRFSAIISTPRSILTLQSNLSFSLSHSQSHPKFTRICRKPFCELSSQTIPIGIYQAPASFSVRFLPRRTNVDGIDRNGKVLYAFPPPAFLLSYVNRWSLQFFLLPRGTHSSPPFFLMPTLLLLPFSPHPLPPARRLSWPDLTFIQLISQHWSKPFYVIRRYRSSCSYSPLVRFFIFPVPFPPFISNEARSIWISTCFS